MQNVPEPTVRGVVLDTDVASRSFKNRLPAALAARLLGAQPLVSFVTVGELTQWTRLRHRGPRNRAMLDAWLADKPVISGGKSIATIWGELSADAVQRGRSRPVNDTWVAACCLAYHLPLGDDLSHPSSRCWQFMMPWQATGQYEMSAQSRPRSGGGHEAGQGLHDGAKRPGCQPPPTTPRLTFAC